uniref:hypothetical protein n=1 Tax=Chroococcidiopsis sp. TS-821 TaxID=1378066 RepID=UPI001AEF91B1|nr:hypothetical protein [Chroococcidiopsis sp. TS-821]
MPGIRVGYLVVTGKHYQPLVERKLLDDLHVSTVSQAIVSEYLASGHYRHHLAHLQAQHRQSQTAMLAALQKYFPASASWTVPNGGTFLWKCLQYQWLKFVKKPYRAEFLLLKARHFSQDNRAIGHYVSILHFRQRRSSGVFPY